MHILYICMLPRFIYIHTYTHLYIYMPISIGIYKGIYVFIHSNVYQLLKTQYASHLQIYSQSATWRAVKLIMKHIVRAYTLGTWRVSF